MIETPEKIHRSGLCQIPLCRRRRLGNAQSLTRVMHMVCCPQVPQQVNDRILNRILVFAGIPVFFGFSLFPFFYYLKVTLAISTRAGVEAQVYNPFRGLGENVPLRMSTAVLQVVRLFINHQMVLITEYYAIDSFTERTFDRESSNLILDHEILACRV